MLKALKKILRMSDDNTQTINGLMADETATLISLLSKVGITETVLRDLVAGVDKKDEPEKDSPKDEPVKDKQDDTLAMSIDAVSKKVAEIEKRLSAVASQKRDIPKVSEKEQPKGYFEMLKTGKFNR